MLYKSCKNRSMLCCGYETAILVEPFIWRPLASWGKTARLIVWAIELCKPFGGGEQTLQASDVPPMW